MLTKEHLKHRIRQNRVKPVFLDGSEHETQMAERLIAIFATGVGRRRSEIENDLAQLADPLTPAFSKLLWDRTKEDEDDGAILDFRWRAFEQAEQVRRGLAGDLSAAEFRKAVGKHLGAEESALTTRLYADLPECRSIASFRALTGEALVQRYNCAQVQGLLMHATNLTVDLKGTTLSERRVFFRQLKFRRLLALVDAPPEDDKLSVTLTGPLALFENAQSYGMRLAQFFPHILSLSRFKLTAELRLKRREVSLVLDHKCGITSHYKTQTAYLPPEMQECIEGFNSKFGDKLQVTATANTDFVHLGKQAYCFPDIKMESRKAGRPPVVYIELFHRWHAHQLEQRVQAMAATSPLILGVSSQLVKAQALEGVAHFTFREFPTPGQLKSSLELGVTD